MQAAARNPSADQQDSDQRRLDRLEWLCFDDKCNRLDALSCSSSLVSFFTRIQVSWADISPSGSHLMLDSSAGDIKSSLGGQQAKEPSLVATGKPDPCHLRKLEIGLRGYSFLCWTTKKPQPNGLEPGDGELPKDTGPASTSKTGDTTSSVVSPQKRV